MFHISVATEFSSAHSLPVYEGDCAALHGHTWRVKAELAVKELDSSGIAFDFRKLKRILSEIVGQFDHTYLNEHHAFRNVAPSAENIAVFIFRELKKKIDYSGAELKSVSVGESERYEATYSE